MRDAFKAAYFCLDGIYRQKAYSTVRLNQALESGSHDGNPLITKIVYGVLDRDIELSFIIEKFASSVKPSVMPILKIGVYCIKYLALPDHTAVNECVELTKSVGKTGVSGFVNAVLKNISQAVKDGMVAYPENELEKISVKNSFPLWALKILVKDYGKETAEKLAAHYPSDNFTHIRINAAKISTDEFRSLLKRDKIDFRPSPLSDALFVSGSLSKLKSDLYTAQSASSMIVCKAVDTRDEQKVLDVCAAPGGKSVYIAALAKNVQVTACDIHPHRVELIEKYAKRMGVQCVVAVKNDATVMREDFKEAFDKVLCDVPCSGFGVLSGKPDIKLFRKESDLDDLAELQSKILETSSHYVKIGGGLIYSTCTVFKKENDAVVLDFLSRNGNFVKEPVQTGFDGVINENGFVQFLPHRDNLDGFFIAKLKRVK